VKITIKLISTNPQRLSRVV